MEDFSEPTIILEYGQVELARLLNELHIMMQALLPGGILRLVSEQVDSVWAIPAWCRKTGNKVIRHNEIRSCGREVSIVEYSFDIKRGNA